MFGATPVSKPMITYFQLHHKEQTSNENDCAINHYLLTELHCEVIACNFATILFKASIH